MTALADNMRTPLLTALCMSCFAANSVLNRAAVAGGHAEAESFALVRVAAGLVVLGAILALRRGTPDVRAPRRWAGAAGLAAYMIGFSLAYRSLDAGIGALILFGTVQIAMVSHASLTGDPPARRQLAGIALAFGGLLIALWPGGEAVRSLAGSLLMLGAGLGWTVYTLAGRGARDPIAVTTSHFLLCLPLVALILAQSGLSLTPTGWVLALVSGGATSGLGYALWYHILPQLPGAQAAAVQLSVPIIAIGLGALLLGEPVALKVALAATLVVGGIGLTLRRRP